MADAVQVAAAATITDYIEELFAPEDDVLRALRAGVAEAGMPEIYISAEAGRLLQVLLAAAGARRVLEIGTLGGYSAIWMARALPADGRLITLEREPAHAALARRFIARAGLAERIEVREGDAHALLRELEAAGERFDACFIDAEKEGYADYLARALTLVREGGLILADNVLWHGDVLPGGALHAGGDDDDDVGLARRRETARTVDAFNRAIAGDAALLSTIVPVRDGIAVAVRRGGGAG